MYQNFCILFKDLFRNLHQSIQTSTKWKISPFSSSSSVCYHTKLKREPLPPVFVIPVCGFYFIFYWKLKISSFSNYFNFNAGCGKLVTACFAAAGVTFGTVPLSVILAAPALAACNAAFSVCESSCVVATLIPFI